MSSVHHHSWRPITKVPHCMCVCAYPEYLIFDSPVKVVAHFSSRYLSSLCWEKVVVVYWPIIAGATKSKCNPLPTFLDQPTGSLLPFTRCWASKEDERVTWYQQQQQQWVSLVYSVWIHHLSVSFLLSAGKKSGKEPFSHSVTLVPFSHQDLSFSFS